MQINEGGNVFKDEKGQPLTQRINKQDVMSTVKWLESVTGLDFTSDIDPKTRVPRRWIGSTGKTATSGDLDLAVDINDINKDELAQKLSAFVSQHGEDPKQWVKKGGEVHFRTPIAGRADTGFVQTDFMFFNNVDWGLFYYAGGAESAYKGMTRNVLMSSLAKQQGLKVGANGVISRTTNKPVTTDPDRAAELLLGPGKQRDDLKNVETIYQNLSRDPERDAKLADFRDYLAREGLAEPQQVQESDANIMARLRDRIVNQGMQVIVEGVRIAHPEDLVFDIGSRGLQQALNGIVSAAQNPQSNTIKWDGKPAIIFGRNDQGQFVLTDKAGFTAKGYSGLATSPEEIAAIMQRRSGERGELVDIYRRLFPLLRAAVPEDYRGYIQADLLFSQQPAQQNGMWVFQPNTVTYEVPVDSALGKQIAQSQAGVAIHTQLSAPGAAPEPIKAANLNPVRGLLIVDPSLKDVRTIQLDNRVVANVKRLISQYGAAIDQFFDPQQLRERKISDLPKLIQQYINSRVRTGSYDNLIGGFGQWVKTKAPAKAPRIFEWATENKPAVAALFQAFLEISSLKNSVVQQLDQQSQNIRASVNGEPGHEGYVGQGLKFVDRMRFSAANFARNNPEQS